MTDTIAPPEVADAETALLKAQEHEATLRQRLVDGKRGVKPADVLDAGEAVQRAEAALALARDLAASREEAAAEAAAAVKLAEAMGAVPAAVAAHGGAVTDAYGAAVRAVAALISAVQVFEVNAKGHRDRLRHAGLAAGLIAEEPPSYMPTPTGKVVGGVDGSQLQTRQRMLNALDLAGYVEDMLREAARRSSVDVAQVAQLPTRAPSYRPADEGLRHRVKQAKDLTQ